MCVCFVGLRDRLQLNEVLQSCDAKHMYGSCNRIGKYLLVQILLCAKITVPQLHVSIFLATDNTNGVINNQDTSIILNSGWTYGLCMYFQQHGSGGRAMGMSGQCIQPRNLKSYIKVLGHINLAESDGKLDNTVLAINEFPVDVNLFIGPEKRE